MAIVTTHPIQYYAPIFRALAQSTDVEPKVFYTWSQTATGPVFDKGFGKQFAWDIPLLDGYEHVFVPNEAKNPGSDHFSGVRTPGLTRAICDWGADAVLVFGWNLASHLGVLRFFRGRLPVLFRGDSNLLDPQGRLRYHLRRLYLRWVYSHVDIAISVGQNNRDYYLWCGVPSERIAFAPHSVDTERFGDLHGDHEGRAKEWRTDLGIPPEAISFVFAAKLQAKKDPLLLLEAFSKLDSSAHLIFVGDGELEAILRDRARGRAHVHFLPFQNQAMMPTVYRLGDVYVLPSRGPGETWGLAMNEAMASGRAVIASSSVGGARDMVREGVTGWAFEAGSEMALERALRAALALGRRKLGHLGEQARALSREWSSQATAEGIAAATVRAVLVRRRKA